MTGAAGQSRKRTVLDYREAKRLARDRDPAVRQAVAAREDVRPEILYYLAEDPEPTVRQAVARNTHAPCQADLMLANDSSSAIRTDLTRKITRLTPDLAPDERSRLYTVVVETLDVLAQDQLVRVRRMLAESLKDVASAPPGVIRRLARDATLSVCRPVLEFSPVLTDEDLLDIIASEPVQGALGAVSRRAQVGETVAEAVVRTGDADAICELLANHGAQIREDLLDQLIDDAPHHPQWHAPIVRRPRLSNRAARSLTRFLTQSLLGELRQRADLDEPTLSAIAEDVERRMHEQPDDDDGDGDGDVGEDDLWPEPTATKVDSGWERTARPDDKFDPGWERDDAKEVDKFEPSWAAEELATDDEHDGPPAERVITEALARGDRPIVFQTLADEAELDESVIRRAVSLRHAKGIVAIAWKAGLSMRVAIQLQLQFVGVAPADLVRAGGDGEFPLPDDDLRWQLQFLARTRG